MKDKWFWDSNLWIYLFTQSPDADDERKRQQLRALLRQNPDLHISAQVLHEVANVLLKKYGYTDVQVRRIITQMIQTATVWPLTERSSLQALALKERFHTSWFDSIILASALEAGCDKLYSEDFQHGFSVDGLLTVENPFR